MKVGQKYNGCCPSPSGHWGRWLLFVSCPVLGCLSLLLMSLEGVGVVEVGLGWSGPFCLRFAGSLFQFDLLLVKDDRSWASAMFRSQLLKSMIVG